MNLLSLWALSLLLAFAFRRNRRLIRWAMLLAAGMAILWIAISLLAECARYDPTSAAQRRLTPAAFTLLSAAAVPQLAAWVLAWFRRDFRQLAAAARRHVAGMLATLGLFATVTGGCLWIGSQLAARGSFDEYDTLFFADPPRYMTLMQSGAVTIDAAVYKHPLFALIASMICRPAMVLLSPHTASVVVSAFFAGLAAALAMQYFRLLLGRFDIAWGLAASLALTPAHLVFGSVPETYAMSAAGLAALHLLVAMAARQAVPLRWAAPAALLAAGATTTHAVTALICLPPLRNVRRLGRTTRWAATLLLCGVAGLTLQHGISRDLVPEGSSGAVRAEGSYLNTRFVQNPAAAAYRIARAVLAESLVGPSLRVERDKLNRCDIRMGGYSTWLQRITLGGAWGLAIVLLIRIIRHAHHHRPTFRAAAACLAFSATLHLFYGNEHVFLFSCTYTFCTLAIVAHGLLNAPASLRLAALLLALVVAFTNASFIVDLLAATAGPPPR